MEGDLTNRHITSFLKQKQALPDQHQGRYGRVYRTYLEVAPGRIYHLSRNRSRLQYRFNDSAATDGLTVILFFLFPVSNFMSDRSPYTQ